MTYGGIEAGGTKFICAVGTGPDEAEVSEPISTTVPGETIPRVIEWFRSRPPVHAIGIGAFGPVDVRTGMILRTTPKIPWRGAKLQERISKALEVPVVTDTDVNAAAFGEFRWGAAQGCSQFLYLTVGTGIGGGGMANGELLHGLLHPEMGHLHLPRHPKDRFAGVCPAHGGDCMEGLICGPALAAREKRGQDADEFAAHYLALGLVNLNYAFSPEKIILGGGVMKRAGLLARVKRRLRELNRGYAPLAKIERPKLGDRAGVLGAIALAAAKAP